MKKTKLMSTISIEGMTFHAYHGCMPEEQITGNTFIVDLFIKANTSKAEQSDDLLDTVDYSAAYNIVKKEMEIPSKLLEHVGSRILESVLNEFTEVESAEIKVSKMNPPIGGHVKNVSVVLKR